MSGWLDEVDTRMNTIIHYVHPIDLVLSIEVGIETLLDVLDNWTPRVVIVDKIAETRSVHDRQSKTNTILFDIRTNGLDGDGFWNDV